MRKRKFLFPIFLFVFMLLMTGCGNHQAISAEDFKGKMEKRDFIVTDVTSQFSDYDYVKKVYVAISPASTYQIEYYYFEDNSYASKFYGNNKNIFEGRESSSHSEVSLGNYMKYSQTGEKYSVVSVTDNTAIYVDVLKKYKSDAKKILKDLGY